MSDEERKQAELEKAQRPDDEEGEGEEENEGEDEEKAGPDDGCGNTGGGSKSRNAPTSKSGNAPTPKSGNTNIPKSESACKSEDLNEDDLEKSLELLENFVEDGDKPTRKQVLLEKAQKDSLDKSEAKELYDLLGDDSPQVEDTFTDEIVKAMEPTDEMQKALDVSDFLSEVHEENKRVTGILAERIEKSDTRQHEYNLVLAKAVAEVGKLTKGISDRLGVIEGQPARKPKSQIKALEKGFANTDPNAQAQTLSKSEILDTMSSMIEESCEKGMDGVVDNINMITAAAKYEQLGQIHPTVLGMIQKKRSAVH